VNTMYQDQKSITKMTRSLRLFVFGCFLLCANVFATDSIKEEEKDNKAKSSRIILDSAIKRLENFEKDYNKQSVKLFEEQILLNELLELIKKEYFNEFYELFIKIRLADIKPEIKEEYHDLLMDILLSSIKKDSGCHEKIKVLMFLENSKPKNEKEKFDFLIATKIFFEWASIEDSKKLVCRYEFYDQYIAQKTQEVVSSSRNFDVSELIAVSKNVIIISDLKEELNKNTYAAQLKLLDLISVMINRKFEGMYVNELTMFFFQSGSQSYLDDFISKNENYFLNFEGRNEDELLQKISIIAPYLGGDRWPFNTPHQRVFQQVLRIKFQKNIANVYYNCFATHALIINLKSSKPLDAKKLYQQHLKNCSYTASLTSKNSRWSNGQLPLFDSGFALLSGAFLINLATEFNDISFANGIYTKQLPYLLKEDFIKEIQNLKSIKEVPFVKIYLYFINFAIIKGDKKNGQKIMEAASKVSGVDFNKISDKNYIDSLHNKYFGKIDDYLDVLKAYKVLIGKSGDKVQHFSYIDSRLRSKRILFDSYDLSKLVFDSVVLDDLDGIRFGLDELERRIKNAKYESDVSVYSMFYGLVSRYLEAFEASDQNPDLSSADSRQKEIKDTFFREVADLLAINYFYYGNTLSDLAQADTLFRLFSFNSELKRKNHSQFYAIQYVQKVKEILLKIQSSTLREEITRNQFSNLGDVIEYFLENDLHYEASFAFEVYKIEDFFQSVRGVPSKTKLNSAADVRAESLSEAYRKQNQSVDSTQILLNEEKILQLKSLINQQVDSYIKKRNLSDKSNDENSYLKKNSKSIPDSASLTLFFKSGNLHMVYKHESNEHVYLKQPVNVTEFSDNIGRFYKTHILRQSKSFDLNFFDLIFEKIIKKIEEDSVSTLFISGNAFINSIPFRLLLTNRNPKNWKVRLVYSGIPSGVSGDDFMIGGASLFAVTKSIGGRGKLDFAREEVELIGTVFTKDTVKSRRPVALLDEDFSKINLFKALGKNNNLIHISTHYDPDPNTGGLLFGDGSVLSSQKLWRELGLTSNSPLVTLASCESGLMIGDGKSLDNLPNVFLSKGAKNVLASTWKISDEATKDFMAIFYSFLLTTEDPAEALTLTQKAFKEKMFATNHVALIGKYIKLDYAQKSLIKYSHPYYWSGFQLIASN
jgi:hypothetical protein